MEMHELNLTLNEQNLNMRFFIFESASFISSIINLSVGVRLDIKCISTHFFHDGNIFQWQNHFDIFSIYIYISFENSNNLEKEKENLLKSASIVTVKDNGCGNHKNVITTRTEISHNNKPKGIPITSQQMSTNQNKSNNAKRRKAEDKMAMIFIAIVTGWLVTNFPRICLNFQEVLNVEKQQKCMELHPNSL